MIVTWIAGFTSTYILPLTYNFREGAKSKPMPPWTSWAGSAIAALGVLLQWLGDEEKFASKEAGGTYMTTGLYSVIRHPNYLGEVLFHTGNWLSAFHAYETVWEGLLSGLFPLFMCPLMFRSSKKRDKQHLKAYGE